MALNGTTTGDARNGIVLKPGDILLKRSEWSPMHVLISLGQKLGGSSKATTVHAAIYVGGNMVSHSHGHGVTTDPLNGHSTWKVYRYAPRPDIADLAADVAQNLALRGANDEGFGSYHKGRSLASAFRSGRKAVFAANDVSNFLNNLDRKGVIYARTFFCSNFSVLCYSLASDILTSHPHHVIALDFERASPGEMAEFFESADGRQRGWRRMGEITG